jgi:hypothetical protein
MFERNYSRCKGRSSENICNSKVLRKKERQAKIQKPFEFHALLNVNLFFCKFFNLILFMTKFKEWVLSFLDFINRLIMLEFITQISMEN